MIKSGQLFMINDGRLGINAFFAPKLIHCVDNQLLDCSITRDAENSHAAWRIMT